MVTDLGYGEAGVSNTVEVREPARAAGPVVESINQLQLRDELRAWWNELRDRHDVRASNVMEQPLFVWSRAACVPYVDGVGEPCRACFEPPRAF